jgi:hypothetical protein
MANNTSPLKPTLITCFQNVTASPMLIATLGMQRALPKRNCPSKSSKALCIPRGYDWGMQRATKKKLALKGLLFPLDIKREKFQDDHVILDVWKK